MKDKEGMKQKRGDLKTCEMQKWVQKLVREVIQVESY